MIIQLHKPKRIQQRIRFYDSLGQMPSSISRRSYMSFYHDHPDYEVINVDQGMGLKIKVRIKVSIKTSGNFLSSIVKNVVNVAKPVMKAVQGVGDVAEDVYAAAKKVAMQALPSQIRGLVSDQIMFLENVVTNPLPTVKNIVETTGEIAKNIVREGTRAAEIAYKEVARPAFRIARNVANETMFKPIHKAVEITVLPVLPKSIRDKVEKIIDVPEAAFAGKLTDKDVVAGVKAYYQLGLIQMKTVGKFNNTVINTLRKDAILGPFLEKVDIYTGGLLTSGQNLSAMPDDLYHDRQVDWKARLVDALKIYLATVAAGNLANFAIGVGTNAVGEETGLNKTPLGRATLAVGSAYAGSFSDGNLSSLAIKDVARTAAISEAKSETVKHAVANGWVDDKFTAQLILSAGGKFYDAAGTDKTLMDTMSEVHDKEFQKYVNREIERRTGLPVTYANLVDVYNTDWGKLADNVAQAMSNIKGISINSSDGNFLSKMGQNFVDEIKRLPQNFSNISQNVLNELQRTPQNLANFASAVAKEADRTPENIAKIANNIAREGTRAAENIIDEAARTPSNVAEITKNVAREIGKTDFESLLTKFGPDIISFLEQKYPKWEPGDEFTPEMLQDIELNYFQRRPGLKPGVLAGGLLGLLALGYFATQD